MASYTGSNGYSAFTLDTAGVTSVVFSADGSRIFASGRDGIISVYDAQTRDLLTSWTVGYSLGGMSLSEDGSFLLAAEGNFNASLPSFVHRIETETGAQQSYSLGANVHDVEVVDGNTAIISGPQMYKLNLDSGVFTPLSGAYYYSSAASVLVEDSHLTLIAEPGISNGPLFLYDDRTGTVTAAGDTYQAPNTGFNFGHQAISEAAGQVAQFLYYGSINIYDLSLRFVRNVNIGANVDGLAYDSSGRYFYANLTQTGKVAKYRVSDWSLVETYSVAGAQWHNNQGYGDQIKFSADGSYMTVNDTYLQYNDSSIGGRLQLIDFTVRNDTFAGTAGADSFTGLDGHDTYYVNNAGDVVIEAVQDGNDKVIASVNYILAANVESLTLTAGAGAITGLGNALDNVLHGNEGANTLVGFGGNDELDGGAGDDSLYGGAGNDVYLVGGQGDIIFENAGEGYDVVMASSGYYLWDNLESLVLASGTGADDFFGVGNGLDNSITGNMGSNLLLGGGGNDVVYGLDGIDLLYGEAGNDTLFGGRGIDYLVGGDGNDVLDGEENADALYGLDGDDILTGGSDFQTDILVGGNGNDTLRGDSALGDYDLMYGGAGNDVYRVDTPSDLTFEAPDGGTDTVFATINGAGYYLYANTENLVLESGTPFGVGNERPNIIIGNGFGNYLLGGGGNDTLYGRGGNDVLFGEGGADIFVLERGTGADVVGDFQTGVDKIRLLGLGFSGFAQVQAGLSEYGGNSALNLGQGELLVMIGVTNAQLAATDFIFG